MRNCMHAFVGIFAAATLVLSGAPALALLHVTYVSDLGSDNNNCTLATPCATITAALAQTDDGGEIACLNGYSANQNFLNGQVSIAKSVTIDCGGYGGTIVNPTVTINGPGIVVRFRNVSLQSFSGAQSAIDFINGSALYLENCLIHGFSGIAVKFRPSTPGSQLLITNTIFAENGTAPSTGGGLQVLPQSGGSAGIVLDHATFNFNVTAMVLNSSSGGIGANMKDSLVTSSRSNGILSQAGTTINFIIDHSSLTNNIGAAIQSSGASSRVFINDSTIFGNDMGVSVVSGGSVLSYKNNRINGNVTDGTPLAPVPGVTGNLQ
jgi:hypothetical protein